MRNSIAGMGFLVACMACGAAGAAPYPDRPIKMIVAWSAGGGTDIPARVTADHLSRQLKVPVIVENRDGASGMIGTEYVARAAPDGYTIQYTVADTHSVAPHLFPGIRYDALHDFVPVAVVGYGPTVLAVNAKLDLDSFDEFINYAKAHPGKLSFASWGLGSGGHVRMAAITNETGIELLHVPFKGSSPALEAVIAGHVDAMIVPASMARPQAESGKIRMLAIDTQERASIAPEVKTYAEQGYAYNLRFWQGVLAPKGTPQAIVDKLNRALDTALSTPEAQADLARVGIIRLSPGDGSAAAAQAYMEEEYERWGKVIKAANINVQ
ncbi:tripartite tricarboxylate transporter substrate binding protein [Bordetella sp. BOR01]|uniref:Bug family tripartite tricarboxylate transporter substrate binding protein n=1 Tax=Bordetella sp. BOR01 TaxID=2854779 RepID=UPI001C45273F|nr:tripartite tricarboxylate transporter substrate binding protein [Bordetella sp. BOR01]MBV7483851.1 tripartite tricarboxylate transporter substrate binding protein [Bordetella sp. BOR01]